MRRIRRAVVPAALLIPTILAFPAAGQAGPPLLRQVEAGWEQGRSPAAAVGIGLTESPSPARIAAGALLGGAAGGAMTGMAAFVVAGGSLEGDNEYAWTRSILPAAVGYAAGAGIGATWAATARGSGPPRGVVVAASFLGAAAAGALWAAAESQFFHEDEGLLPMAALSLATHLATTTLVARRSRRQRT